MGGRRRRRAKMVPMPTAGDPLARTTSTQLIAAQYSGPLPPAQQLERYEHLLPGAADRIIKQWELQTEHRRRLESKVVDSNVAATKRGQWFAALITFASLALAGWLFSQGLSGWAFAVVFADLAAIVLVAYGARRRQESERTAKRQPN